MIQRYFFQGDVDAFAEQVGKTMYWYQPTRPIAEEVQESGHETVIKCSDGTNSSLDDFWRASGDLVWDVSRLGQQMPRVRRPRVGQAVAS